jgi:hypothetical protein
VSTKVPVRVCVRSNAPRLFLASYLFIALLLVADTILDAFTTDILYFAKGKFDTMKALVKVQECLLIHTI